MKMRAKTNRVILHGPERSEGADWLAKSAWTAVVRNWKTLRDCWRQVSGPAQGLRALG